MLLLHCFTGEHLSVPVNFFSPFDPVALFHPRDFQLLPPLSVVITFWDGMFLAGKLWLLFIMIAQASICHLLDCVL